MTANKKYEKQSTTNSYAFINENEEKQIEQVLILDVNFRPPWESISWQKQYT